MDRLTSMQVFRTVVEEGAFARAARRRRMSTAAVSKHVAALESSLGTRLLHRTTRSLGLTSAGRAYYDRACQLLDELDQLEESVRSDHNDPVGLLRVAVPMTFGLAQISPLVPKFLARYPKVELDLSLTERMVDVVDEGMDLAVRVTHSLPDSTLIAKRLGSFERVLVAAPSYLQQRGPLRIPADLKQQECIRYNGQADPATWTFRGPEGSVSVRVQGRYAVDNSLAMRAALLAGSGLAVLPTLVVGDDLRQGKLIRCLPSWEPEKRSVFAVYPTPRHLSPKVRAFVAFVQSNLEFPCAEEKPK